MIRLAFAILLVASSAVAEPGRPPPLRGSGIEEHVGTRIPLDLTFNDAAGRRIQLAELFGGGKPVLMVLAYMRCKMLCSLVLSATTEAVRGRSVSTEYSPTTSPGPITRSSRSPASVFWKTRTLPSVRTKSAALGAPWAISVSPAA